MLGHCYGCGGNYKDKRGLNNHRRVCSKWKNFDGVGKLKRKRLEDHTMGSSSRRIPLPDMPRPVQPSVIEDDDAPEDTLPSVEVPPLTSTRSGRSVRFPGRYRDYLPMTRTALAHVPSKERPIPPPAVETSTADASDTSSPVATDLGSQLDDQGLGEITTDADCFGIYRVYARKPVYSPLPYDDVNVHTDSPSPDGQLEGPEPSSTFLGPPHLEQTGPYFHPFSNPSAAAVMVAHHSGSLTQSLGQTTRIAHILGSLGSDLDPDDLLAFDATLENRKLAAYLASPPDTMSPREDGWSKSSVRIRLPLDKEKMLESEAAQFDVPGVFHRDIIDVISSVYQSDAVRSFNLVPFKEYWKPSENATPERLYGEIFTSQAMIDSDNDMRKYTHEHDLDSEDLENVTVPLMLYSDSTHLASFGTASCWPIYLFLGSQSKYIRDKPSSHSCHHIAYMPKVSLIVYRCHSMISIY
jgi:hypothetical protein